MITENDRNLLVRCARIVKSNAEALHATHSEAWPLGLKEKEKRDHERLLREERDLRAMVKRLEKAGLVQKAEPVVADTGAPKLEPELQS